MYSNTVSGVYGRFYRRRYEQQTHADHTTWKHAATVGRKAVAGGTILILGHRLEQPC